MATSNSGESPSLVPDQRVQKFLVSTTSRILGDYRSERILVTHAWPVEGTDLVSAWSESPVSCSAYAVVVRTPDSVDYDGAVIPNFSHIGRILCDYMSLLFGKRFDNHGMTEGSGYFKLPDFSNLAMRCLHTLPHNSHKPRVDYPVLLDFKQLSRIAPLVNFTFADSTKLDIARTSIKFYAQALRRVEGDPEAAYLDLVTCGEVLSSAANYDAATLLGSEMADILELMRSQLPDGDRLARMVGSRMRGIKRAYVMTLTDRLPADFFSHRESLPEGCSLQADDFERRVAAAYDLRSLHLHTGAPFGTWVAPRYRSNDEIQGGAPVVTSESLAKALKFAPTFVGLERITRACLLHFLSECGALTAGGAPE